MLEKIKNHQNHPVFQELRDIRVLGMVVFAVIVLMVCWSGVRVIETNYRLEQQIARLEEENKLRDLENANKKLENQYFESDQYLELQARKVFGKAAPGETLLLVPEEVALSHTAELPEDGTGKSQDSTPAKPAYQENFEAWMNFFFRRSEPGAEG